MLITITIISILAIAAATWGGSKILRIEVCPICAGIFLTWAGLLGAHFTGYEIPLVIPALLMGGSVVGIAYQLAPRVAVPLAGQGPSLQSKRLLWKVLFMPAGFLAAYGVLEQLWTVSLASLGFLVLISFYFLSFGGTKTQGNGAANDIEEKMKDCC